MMNEEQAYQAAKNALAWTDRSSLGKLELRGADVLDLLNRLSTNEVKNLKTGEGIQTVLTTDKGRIVDVLHILARENSFLVLCSDTNAPRVQQWLRKYTIMDDVKSKDVSVEYGAVEILGPQAASFVEQALGTSAQDFSMYHWRMVSLSGIEAVLVRREPVSEIAYLLLYPMEQHESVLEAFRSYGDEIPEISAASYEVLRAEAGAGKFGHEWTEDFNPLEAGLLHLVSFKKGCYVGQEVIARLDSYNKVKQRIIGILSDEELAPGAKIMAENAAAGVVTSTVYSPRLQSHFSLGYLRNEFAQPGAGIRISSGDSEREATIVKIPL